MPGTNAHIAKGKILIAADANLATPTQALLDGIKNAPKMSQRAVDVGVMQSSDIPHVDQDWFGNKWWAAPNAEAIAKEAYVKAIGVSLANNPVLPVVTYWVAGVCETFEAVVAKSDKQVTLFLVTPNHPPVTLPTDPAQAVTEDLWLIAETKRVDAVKATFPGSYNMNGLDNPTDSAGIRCLQLKGY